MKRLFFVLLATVLLALPLAARAEDGNSENPGLAVVAADGNSENPGLASVIIDDALLFIGSLI